MCVEDRSPSELDASIQHLIGIVGRLRGNDGCPWDKEQTLESLKHCLIEESYEVIDAVECGDPEKLKEELGDVLLQILLQSHIAGEQGKFTFMDVADSLAAKIVRRHPHVFGDAKVSDCKDVLKNWEKIKAKEKAGSNHSIVDGGPRHLPALQKAQRIQTRAARIGFDWVRVEDVTGKIEEELLETKQAVTNNDAAEIKQEIGDLLFAVINLSRFLKINAEEALGLTIEKFRKRFKEIERRVRDEGRELTECSLAEMDAHWENIKNGERPVCEKQ